MKSIEVTQLNKTTKITIFIDKIMWVSETNQAKNSRIGLVGGENAVITAELDYDSVLKLIEEAK